MNGLDFHGEDFSSDHVIAFFNTIAESDTLQCVFLNGCDNSSIVRKLTKVPLVIGTRSKVDDKVAGKFTKDFFMNLIGGEKTYEEAFDTAVVGAKISSSDVSKNTRSESSSLDPNKKEELNQYYLIKNNPKVADQKFPFNSPPRNWTKYIFLLILLITLSLGFVFKNSLAKTFAGHSCEFADFANDTTCNLVIGDFQSIGNANQESVLAKVINFNTHINKLIQARSVEDFRKYIKESKIPTLPSLCGYDFNVSGYSNDDKINFKIEPYVSNTLQD
ncbi:MAG: hypothetical protein M3R25_06100, partial [Bacteroidota bacterium]|nr:hypothetical protein [Bacteroidota bacterium]